MNHMTWLSTIWPNIFENVNIHPRSGCFNAIQSPDAATFSAFFIFLAEKPNNLCEIQVEKMRVIRNLRMVKQMSVRHPTNEKKQQLLSRGKTATQKRGSEKHA